jgi:enoyl-CoA hydratase/carnithine racemase
MLRVEDRAPGVRVLTLDRPERLNALDPETLAALEAALRDDAGVRCRVLTGAGERAFCSGYDLLRLGKLGPSDPLPDEAIARVAAAIEAAPAPTIAAVNGIAYGAGGELAAACDLRVASRTAKVCMPPAKLGIVYAQAGLFRFVRLVGFSQAKRLFFTGDVVDAEEGLRLGVFDEVADDALAAALALASRIADNAPLAVAGMKRLFNELQGEPLLDDEESAALRRASFNSADAEEGVAAAREKRKPNFRGA